MKNIEFVKSQTEKIVAEMKLSASEQFTTFEVVGGRFDNPEEYSKFVDYKFTVIEICKSKTVPELKKILGQEIKKLCPACKAGLDKFSCECTSDLPRFILCEYIKRTIM